MGNIKIILKKDVPNLGEEGDVKNVKTGFARNFLFPRSLAVDYSLQNRNIFEKQMASIEKRKLEKKENAKALKDKLEGEKISVTITAGDKGRLYGTVTTSVIADEFVKLGYTFDKKMIELKEHIKFAGSYKINVHVYQEVYATVELTVVAKQEEKKEDTRPQRRKKKFNRYSEYEDGTYDLPESEEEREEREEKEKKASKEKVKEEFSEDIKE
jgi:large subunit ribosomal protein L9